MKNYYSAVMKTESLMLKTSKVYGIKIIHNGTPHRRTVNSNSLPNFLYVWRILWKVSVRCFFKSEISAFKYIQIAFLFQIGGNAVFPLSN